MQPTRQIDGQPATGSIPRSLARALVDDAAPATLEDARIRPAAGLPGPLPAVPRLSRLRGYPSKDEGKAGITPA
jgi:hypothetical protein